MTSKSKWVGVFSLMGNLSLLTANYVKQGEYARSGRFSILLGGPSVTCEYFCVATCVQQLYDCPVKWRRPNVGSARKTFHWFANDTAGRRIAKTFCSPLRITLSQLYLCFVFCIVDRQSRPCCLTWLCA